MKTTKVMQLQWKESCAESEDERLIAYSRPHRCWIGERRVNYDRAVSVTFWTKAEAFEWLNEAHDPLLCECAAAGTERKSTSTSCDVCGARLSGERRPYSTTVCRACAPSQTNIGEVRVLPRR